MVCPVASGSAGPEAGAVLGDRFAGPPAVGNGRLHPNTVNGNRSPSCFLVSPPAEQHWNPTIQQLRPGQRHLLSGARPLFAVFVPLLAQGAFVRCLQECRPGCTKFSKTGFCNGSVPLFSLSGKAAPSKDTGRRGPHICGHTLRRPAQSIVINPFQAGARPTAGTAGLHQAAVQLSNLLHTGIAGVARAAGVCKGAFCQELHVLFL